MRMGEAIEDSREEAREEASVGQARDDVLEAREIRLQSRMEGTPQDCMLLPLELPLLLFR